MPEKTIHPHPIVLLIENDTQTSRSISRQLAESGYQVSLASDETEAIATQVQPAAIIFNLARPILDLIDSGSRIRAALQVTQSPVIVVAWRRSKVMALGNNVYVIYTTDFQQLELLLKSLLSP